MNEQDKNKNIQEEAPKKAQGAAAQPSSWKSLLSKRWVFPAIYTAAAAIILTLVWVYQDAGVKPLGQDSTATVTESVNTPAGEDAALNGDPKAVEVVANAESAVWPVSEPADVQVVKPFYEQNGTEENHVEAMVQFNDTFLPNTGIDLAREDRKPFDVTAALSGKVTRVENTPHSGSLVEVTHPDNRKTVYQSLSDVKVKQGDEVKQGDKLASAGTFEMEKDLGNHVHFEIHEDGKPVNPAELLPER